MFAECVRDIAYVCALYFCRPSQMSR